MQPTACCRLQHSVVCSTLHVMHSMLMLMCCSKMLTQPGRSATILLTPYNSIFIGRIYIKLGSKESPQLRLSYYASCSYFTNCLGILSFGGFTLAPFTWPKWDWPIRVRRFAQIKGLEKVSKNGAKTCSIRQWSAHSARDHSRAHYDSTDHPPFVIPSKDY